MWPSFTLLIKFLCVQDDEHIVWLRLVTNPFETEANVKIVGPTIPFDLWHYRYKHFPNYYFYKKLIKNRRNLGLPSLLIHILLLWTGGHNTGSSIGCRYIMQYKIIQTHSVHGYWYFKKDPQEIFKFCHYKYIFMYSSMLVYWTSGYSRVASAPSSPISKFVKQPS